MSISLERLGEIIASIKPEAESLLETVVNINSFTDNKSGADEVGKVFKKKFEELGFESEVKKRDNVGDIILLTNKAYKKTKKGGFLFLSHMDTVFPLDGHIIPYTKKDGIIRGNGSVDDKGGGVIAWITLRALKEAGLLDSIPVRVLLNTDEETGSIESKDEIMEISSDADLVFVVEYGKPRSNGGTIVTSRFGRGSFNVDIKGERAEIAMLEIIESITNIAFPEERRTLKIRDYEKGDSFCKARIYFGYVDEPEGAHMKREIEKAIKKTFSNNEIAGEYSCGSIRPPLIYSDKHWGKFEKLTEIASQIGFKIYPEHRISCSDGSFVPHHIPVLDGIGPIGDNVHTDDEHMLESSLTIKPLLIASMMVL